MNIEWKKIFDGIQGVAYGGTMYRVRPVDGGFVAEALALAGNADWQPVPDWTRDGFEGQLEYEANLPLTKAAAKDLVVSLIEHKSELALLRRKTESFGIGKGPETVWGKAQNVKHMGAGIIEYKTAGHGGYFVPKELNDKIHKGMRASDGWYSEDGDVCIVKIFHPQHFTAAELRYAVREVARVYPEIWEEIKEDHGHAPAIGMRL